eukprot:IDg12134t1
MCSSVTKTPCDVTYKSRVTRMARTKCVHCSWVFPCPMLLSIPLGEDDAFILTSNTADGKVTFAAVMQYRSTLCADWSSRVKSSSSTGRY